MSLRFLHDYGARRVRNYAPQPILIDDGLMATDEPGEETGLDYEIGPGAWRPRDVSSSPGGGTWPLCPR